MAEEQKQEPTPTEKAWSYLAKVVKEPDVYRNLRSGNTAIVTGSCGGKYILYPNGHIVRLDKDAPKLGKVSAYDMPSPDVVATAYAWITTREEEFLKNWGCGNITVRSQKEIMEEEARERTSREIVIATARAHAEHRRRMASDSVYRAMIENRIRAERRQAHIMSAAKTVSVVAAFGIIAFVLISNSNAIMAAFSTPASSTEVAQAFAQMMPLIIVVALCMILISFTFPLYLRND